jgi:hypothetical protein
MATNNAINFSPLNLAQSWTPVLLFNGSSIGITYTTQIGSYQQIGNIVFYSFFILLSSIGSHGSTTTATISGLPINSSVNQSFGIEALIPATSSVNTYSMVYNNGSRTLIYLMVSNVVNSSNVPSGTAVQWQNLTNTSFINASGFYFTN